MSDASWVRRRVIALITEPAVRHRPHGRAPHELPTLIDTLQTADQRRDDGPGGALRRSAQGGVRGGVCCEAPAGESLGLFDFLALQPLGAISGAIAQIARQA